MTSIFDVEKRLPLNIECKRINDFVISNKFYIKVDMHYYSYNLYEIIDSFVILNWEHRHTATCLKEYLSYFDINFHNFKNTGILYSDVVYLHFLEAIVNLIYLLISNSKIYSDIEFDDSKKFESYIKVLLKNIDLTLEANNLKKYTLKNSTIQFTKRDADSDSAINVIKDRDIALDILSFLDFRNENNINEKKSIITRLYKHLEANQSTYKSIRIKSSAISKDINPYDDFFLLANKFDIRHHPKDLLKNGTFQKLDDNRTIEVLDICFRLFLRIVNTSQAVIDQDYINNLKQEFNIM